MLGCTKVIMRKASSKNFTPSQWVLLIILVAQPGLVMAQQVWSSSTPPATSPADAIVAESFPVAVPAPFATVLPMEPFRPAGPSGIAPVVFITVPRAKTAPHPFWDRENRTLFEINGALAGADFYTTRRNLGSYGKELNPVARMFAGSTPGLAANFALETGGVIGVSYLFHMTGHHKIERMTSYVNLGASAFAVGYGLAHH
jgi:hypothetical protein